MEMRVPAIRPYGHLQRPHVRDNAEPIADFKPPPPRQDRCVCLLQRGAECPQVHCDIMRYGQRSEVGAAWGKAPNAPPVLEGKGQLIGIHEAAIPARLSIFPEVAEAPAAVV